MNKKQDAYKTKCLDGSLSPKWNDSRLISIPKMTEEILEAFESDSITFTVYGKQVEGKGTAPKVSHLVCRSFIAAINVRQLMYRDVMQCQ